MLYLCYILQLVVDCLDDCPFPKQQPVRDGHQRPFHIALELGNELYAVHKEALKQPLANISLVAYELAVYGIHERLVFQRLAVVNVTGCYHEVEQLAHLRYAPENLLDEDSLVTAHMQRSAVDEADSGAFVQQYFLNENGQRNSHFLLLLHKAVVGHDIGKHNDADVHRRTPCRSA